MRTRSRWQVRRGAWLALALLGVAAGALAWPEPSLPPHREPGLSPAADGRVVLHQEWAARLVELLGMRALLPNGAAPEDLFRVLAEESEPGAARDAAISLAPPPSGSGAPRPDGGLPFQVVARTAAPYAVVVAGRGPGRWTLNGRSLGLLDPTPLGVSASGLVVPLGSGVHELVVYPAAGARIDGVGLTRPLAGPIAPAAGWRRDAALTFGDKARTLVQALGLEGRLPLAGESLVLEGGSPVAPPAAPDATAASARASSRPPAGGPSELVWALQIATAGVWSLLARDAQGEPQLWLVDGRPVRRPAVVASASNRGFSEVTTLHLAPGAYDVRARLPEPGTVASLHALQRRTEARDYLAVLEALGLEEGHPEAAVTVADAERNLASAPVRELLGTAAGARLRALALLEEELERFYARPLSPVLPTER